MTTVGGLRRDGRAPRCDAFGTVDILVNNLGAAIAGDVVDTTEESWDRTLDISLRTTFLASKFAVPVMAAQGAGAIVNVGSINAVRGTRYLAYAAAKGGVHALTVDMAYAHGRQGIRVNAVVPGHITTPLLYSVLGDTPETEYRRAARRGVEPARHRGDRRGTSRTRRCSWPATRRAGSPASHCPSTVA